MGITIAQTSKETVEQLIRKEFHAIDFKLDYIYGKSKRLIQTAKDFGLVDLAEELENTLT